MTILFIRKISRLYCVLMLAFAALSCDSIDIFDERPAYLQIDSFVLADNPNADEGSLNHNIVDAWVFIDDEMIGVFELPATIPIRVAVA